jgi:hypothetical protein
MSLYPLSGIHVDENFSVSDPHSLNPDPDPGFAEFGFNLDQDPDQGFFAKKIRKNYSLKKQSHIFLLKPYREVFKP